MAAWLLGRVTTVIFVGITAALLGASPSGAAGGGILRSIADAAGTAGRKIDLDSPPLERALPMLGDGPEAHGRLAVLEAPEGRGYYLVAADGSRLDFYDDDSLLAHLDDMTRKGDDSVTPVFSEGDYFRLRHQLADRPVSDSARVLLGNGDVVPVRRITGPKGPSLALEVRPNFFYEARTALEFDEFEAMLRVSFDVPDVQVVSLFDESDHRIRAALDGAAGEAHMDLTGLTTEEVLTRLGLLKRRIVVVVGHVEGEDFVIRGADGGVVARVPVAEMERIADEADASLILLGCDTVRVAMESSGLSAPVRDIAVAEALTRAMRADDYGGFLSGLATEAAPLLVRAPTARRHGRIMEAKRLGDAREINRLMQANVISVAIGGRSPAVVAERRSRIIPFVPVWVHVLYVSGTLGSLFMIRSLWREWAALFPLLGGRTGWCHGAGRAVRAAGFALTGPAVGALVLLAMPLALALLFLPLVPWSASVRMLGWIEVAPFRLLRVLLNIGRAAPR